MDIVSGKHSKDQSPIHLLGWSLTNDLRTSNAQCSGSITQASFLIPLRSLAIEWHRYMLVYTYMSSQVLSICMHMHADVDVYNFSHYVHSFFLHVAEDNCMCAHSPFSTAHISFPMWCSVLLQIATASLEEISSVHPSPLFIRKRLINTFYIKSPIYNNVAELLSKDWRLQGRGAILSKAYYSYEICFRALERYIQLAIFKVSE